MNKPVSNMTIAFALSIYVLYLTYRKNQSITGKKGDWFSIGYWEIRLDGLVNVEKGKISK